MFHAIKNIAISALSILFFLLIFNLFSSSSFAQQCSPVAYHPQFGIGDQNLCTNSLGYEEFYETGYAFDQNCEEPGIPCKLWDDCTKYTGQQCCTGAAGVGNLTYDYCQQNTPVFDGSSWDYTIQCCINPTPTPSPSPTPTATPTPTPTPTPTLWLITGRAWNDVNPNFFFDSPPDVAYSGASIGITDITGGGFPAGSYITNASGQYTTSRIWPNAHSINVAFNTSLPAGCSLRYATPQNIPSITSDVTVNWPYTCESPTPTPTNSL